MNIPVGSVSEGNILVMRPCKNFAASGPCNATNPRRGVRLTDPELGSCGGNFELEVELRRLCWHTPIRTERGTARIDGNSTVPLAIHCVNNEDGARRISPSK